MPGNHTGFLIGMCQRNIKLNHNLLKNEFPIDKNLLHIIICKFFIID